MKSITGNNNMMNYLDSARKNTVKMNWLREYYNNKN